eukprot:UN11687
MHNDEGLTMYSKLLIQNLIRLNWIWNLTPKNTKKTLKIKNMPRRSSWRLRLNDSELIQQVIEQIPTKNIPL